ncbi:MAG: rhodanese-like domain-containing protein [Nanoarchaeota archaeon]
MKSIKIIFIFSVFFLFGVFLIIFNPKTTGFSILNFNDEKTADDNFYLNYNFNKNINVKDAFNLLNNNDFLFIDVRTKDEHLNEKINNSINIDFNSKNFIEEISKLKKDKKYIVYCKSSKRSKSTMNIMNELGFNNVYNLEGGLILWKKNNLPLI